MTVRYLFNKQLRRVGGSHPAAKKNRSQRTESEGIKRNKLERSLIKQPLTLLAIRMQKHPGMNEKNLEECKWLKPLIRKSQFNKNKHRWKGTMAY